MKRRQNSRGKRFKGRAGINSAVRINNNLVKSQALGNLIRVENPLEEKKGTQTQVNSMP